MNGAKLEIFEKNLEIFVSPKIHFTKNSRWVPPLALPHLSVNAIFKYRVYSIERRPRILLPLDQTPQMEAKLPVNVTPNQKNAALTGG